MYYRLTYRSTADRKSRGDSVLCGYRPLLIGQTVSCDVRLPESEEWAPQVFAVILPDERHEGWIVVRRTDEVSVRLNGAEVMVAQVLKDGDVLTLADGKIETVLGFEVCEDGDYHPNEGVVHRRRHVERHLYWLTALWCLVAVAIAGFAWWTRNGGNGLGGGLDCTAYEGSVYPITTDSVFVVCDTVENGVVRRKVMEAAALECPEQGTCFLTDEGLLVTARHCVEPWIVDHDEWNGEVLDENTPVAVRMAVEVENWNRMGQLPRREVIAHSVVSCADGFWHFYSTDFCMDKTRDQVVCLGTDAKPLFWRTIMPMASRCDMELGDFAYVKTPNGEKGNIGLASIEDLRLFENQHDKNVAVLGFPISDKSNTERVSVVYGNSQHVDFADSLSTMGCIKMSAPIGDGNSGGPVLAHVGNRIMSIGIVSKGDGVGTYSTFWAVPTAEVVRLFGKGGVAEEDSLIFRR